MVSMGPQLPHINPFQGRGLLFLWGIIPTVKTHTIFLDSGSKLNSVQQ